MDQEVNQIEQAILVAYDPVQSNLHQQALQYLLEIQKNSSETWRLGLALFTDLNADGSRKHHPPPKPCLGVSSSGGVLRIDDSPITDLPPYEIQTFHFRHVSFYILSSLTNTLVLLPFAHYRYYTVPSSHPIGGLHFSVRRVHGLPQSSPQYCV